MTIAVKISGISNYTISESKNHCYELSEII